MALLLDRRGYGIRFRKVTTTIPTTARAVAAIMASLPFLFAV